MTPRSRWLILALALLGLAFASSSAWVHYKLLTDASYVSPCDINATFNCSQVYLSPYGSIGGVPVAIGGMFWFGLVALVAAFAVPSKARAGRVVSVPARDDRPGRHSLSRLSSFSASDGVCALHRDLRVGRRHLHRVRFSILSSHDPDSSSYLRRPGRCVAPAGRHCVALVFCRRHGRAWSRIFRRRARGPAAGRGADARRRTQDFATAWAKQPRVDLGIPADGAKVVVVKFNDYQCPGVP